LADPAYADLQVVDAPEILAIIGEWPHLSEFLNALYDCQYKQFFHAFGEKTFSKLVPLVSIVVQEDIPRVPHSACLSPL
jgi:hypothetical protein